MSAPDQRDGKAPFADDGIPVLTEVVDSALVPPPQLDAQSPAMLEPEGPPSLAMFPELEPDAPQPPVTLSQPVVAANPAPAEHSAAGVVTPISASADEAAREIRPFTTAEQAVARDPFSSAAPRWPAVPTSANVADAAATGGGPEAVPPAFEPLRSVPAAWRTAPAAADESTPDAPNVASVPPDLPTSAMPAPVQPAVASAAAPAATAKDVETRIFESIAARLDQLLEARLEGIVPVVVEAALAGVQAGMAASVKQALREAVEHAVRDEFEARQKD